MMTRVLNRNLESSCIFLPILAFSRNSCKIVPRNPTILSKILQILGLLGKSLSKILTTKSKNKNPRFLSRVPRGFTLGCVFARIQYLEVEDIFRLYFNKYGLCLIFNSGHPSSKAPINSSRWVAPQRCYCYPLQMPWKFQFSIVNCNELMKVIRKNYEAQKNYKKSSNAFISTGLYN